jgi:hypothetical protein
VARFIALTCEALARSVYAAAATSPHTVTTRFFRQGLHNTPKVLRNTLQDEVDAIQPGECDAILLAYGLCGTSTARIMARHTPIVMPRAHDCITLYLGSRARYQEEFDRHPGTYWYSTDYMERQEPGAAVALGAAGIGEEEAQYDAWVAKWGTETADLLREEMQRWAKHYTRAAFIDTGLGDMDSYEAKAQQKATAEGWVYERLPGNRRLITELIHGNWPEDEYLLVPPGFAIRQSADEGVVECVPVAELEVQPAAAPMGDAAARRAARKRRREAQTEAGV